MSLVSTIIQHSSAKLTKGDNSHNDDVSHNSISY
jgi:hypothetical protein